MRLGPGLTRPFALVHSKRVNTNATRLLSGKAASSVINHQSHLQGLCHVILCWHRSTARAAVVYRVWCEVLVRGCFAIFIGLGTNLCSMFVYCMLAATAWQQNKTKHQSSIITTPNQIQGQLPLPSVTWKRTGSGESFLRPCLHPSCSERFGHWQTWTLAAITPQPQQHIMPLNRSFRPEAGEARSGVACIDIIVKMQPGHDCRHYMQFM